MERLSRELIAHIASFLEREEDQSDVPQSDRKKLPSKLPPFATISHDWQYAIERRTYHELRVRNDDIGTFQINCVGHRRLALAVLRYDVVLPTYDDKACARFEREKDKQINDETFTRAIETLFRVLKSWESGSQSNGRLSLVIDNVYSPMDGIHRGLEIFKNDRFQEGVGKRRDLFEYRYIHSSIHLLHPDELPSLSLVTRLIGVPVGTRIIDMCAVVDIAGKLSNLQRIEWNLNDNEKRYPDLRQRARLSFSEALMKYDFPNLKIADVSFLHNAPSNHHALPAPMIPTSKRQDDPFSTALRKLSQSPNLKSLNFSGVIDPSFFWPSSSSPSENQLIWPALETLHVTFDITSPSGTWYFERDPNDQLDESTAADDNPPAWDGMDSDSATESTSFTSGDDPDDFDPAREEFFTGQQPVCTFRGIPNNQTLPPLLEAMAKAAAQMPKLQALSLSIYLDAKEVEWAVSYYAPDRCPWVSQGEADDLPKRRLYWEVGNWRPDPELSALWRKVQADSGVEMVERFF